MSKLSTLTPIAAVLAVSVAGMAHAAENPFAIKPATGIVVADAGKAAGSTKTEGSCGGKKEGSCGGKKSEDSAGASKDAKAEADKAQADADKAKKEGKCGEAKCGSKKYGVN